MKLAAIVLASSLASSSSFTVVPHHGVIRGTSRTTTTSNSRPSTTTVSDCQHELTRLMASSSAAVVTGLQGKPATSFEEDLRLTLLLIMDHEARSTTTTKEQMVQQVQESLALEEAKIDPIDVSIPYDAASQLAYQASNKSIEYAEFKAKFEADAVGAVIAKQPKKAAAVAVVTDAPADASPEPVDISIPYDAAARLAYEASDKSIDYGAFKEKFEAEAVAGVSAKQQPKGTPAVAAAAPAAVVVDLSIPYDAAAKLAYESSDRSMEYDAFKKIHEAAAVVAVMAKQPRKNTVAAVEATPAAAPASIVDLSIPYDAAAKLAFEGSDKTMEYSAFKEKFEADAVVDVMAKKSA